MVVGDGPLPREHCVLELDEVGEVEQLVASLAVDGLVLAGSSGEVLVERLDLIWREAFLSQLRIHDVFDDLHIGLINAGVLEFVLLVLVKLVEVGIEELNLSLIEIR